MIDRVIQAINQFSLSQLPSIIVPMGNCVAGPKHLRYNPQTKVSSRQMDKVEIDRIDSAPHRWTGALVSHDRYGNWYYGSAVLISSDLILTVAHNIYNIDSKSQYLNFRLYLAPCGLVKEAIQIKKGCWRFPEQFKTIRADVRYYYDYAIMKLSKSVPLLKEPLALHVMCGKHIDEFKKAALSIYGYPQHLTNYQVKGQPGEMELFQYGQVRNDLFHNIAEDCSLIQYFISTLDGHSGSPIINFNNIIGLHFGGGIEESQSYNKGRLITGEVMQQLINWEKELDGSPFVIENERMCNHVNQTIRQNAQQRALNRKLEINSAGLRQIDMEFYNHFREINLQTNFLVNIDLSKSKLLSKLYLGQNQLTEINIRENKMLTQLRLSKNQIKTIDLSTNQELTYVDLSSNQLQDISLINNWKIKQLCLFQNKLKSIHFCYVNRLDLGIQNQNSPQCRVNMMYLQKDYEDCLLKKTKQQDHYQKHYPNHNRYLKYPNLYGCTYIFQMTKGA